MVKEPRHYGRLQEARRIAEILRGANPRRIILFGSQVTGRAGPESDIDLCVLIDSNQGRPLFRIKQDLYRFLLAHGYRFSVDVDMHVYTVDDFQDKLSRGDPFLREIVAGKVLYDRR